MSPKRIETELRRPLILQPRLQHYAWGRPVSQSIISSLVSGIGVAASAAVVSPLAELWIGAHQSAPSLLLAEGSVLDSQGLDRICRDYPEVLGLAVHREFNGSLPFLLKVLSIAQPLSLQLHPDAVTAKLLHAEDPRHYPDRNAKPEIGVALCETELLYGFRTKAELQKLLSCCHELADAVGIVNGSVEEAFKTLYSLPTEQVRRYCQQVFQLASVERIEPQLAYWICRLAALYPEGEIGVLAFLFLNLVSLSPGEAVFIAANVPHAYLSGELVECMANSDNVIRAGLTSKFCDVERLLELADYSVGLPERIVTRAELQPRGSTTLAEENPSGTDGLFRTWTRYQCAARQFALYRLLPEEASSSTSPAASVCYCGTSSGVELLFCLTGEAEIEFAETGLKLVPGSAILLPASCPPVLTHCGTADLFRVTYPAGEL